MATYLEEYSCCNRRSNIAALLHSACFNLFCPEVVYVGQGISPLWCDCSAASHWCTLCWIVLYHHHWKDFFSSKSVKISNYKIFSFITHYSEWYYLVFFYFSLLFSLHRGNSGVVPGKMICQVSSLPNPLWYPDFSRLSCIISLRRNSCLQTTKDLF